MLLLLPKLQSCAQLMIQELHAARIYNKVVIDKLLQELLLAGECCVVRSCSELNLSSSVCVCVCVEPYPINLCTPLIISAMSNSICGNAFSLSPALEKFSSLLWIPDLRC